MGRKGLKPIKKWISTKKGISQRTYYIKNEKPYIFRVANGSKLSIFARTLDEAKRKAKSWERQINKKGFNEKVLLTTGKLER